MVLAKRTDGSGRVAAIKKIGYRTEDDAVLALEEARTLKECCVCDITTSIPYFKEALFYSAEQSVIVLW